MSMQFYKALLTCVSAFALAACGGGGGSSPSTPPSGGGTPPPPPPPPPTNSAPVASISVSDMSPNEGRKSSLDASGSSDSDGDPITFSWTQLSGPDLLFSSSSEAITEITVPNLLTDQTARIQLQVSDGTDTATEETTLSLVNVDLQPRYSEAGTVFSPRSIGVYDYAGKITRFLDNLTVIYDTGQTEDIAYDTVNSTITASPFLEGIVVRDVDNASITPLIFDTFPNGTALTDYDADTVYLTNTNPSAAAGSESLELSATQPCSVRKVFSFAVVGQRNNGIKIFDQVNAANLPPNYSVVETIEPNISACAINSFNDGAIAYDENTGEILLLRYVDAAGNFLNFSINNFDDIVSLAVAERIIPDINLPDGVNAEFVKAIPYQSSYVSDRGLVLLYSDGEVDGNHRIVFAGFSTDGNRNPVLDYNVHQWTYGVPHDALNARTGGVSRNFDEVIITTKDSPFAVIFAQNNTLLNATSWNGPHYMEVGVGVTNIAPYFSNSTANALWMNYAIQNKIELLDVSP